MTANYNACFVCFKNTPNINFMMLHITRVITFLALVKTKKNVSFYLTTSNVVILYIMNGRDGKLRGSFGENLCTSCT